MSWSAWRKWFDYDPGDVFPIDTEFRRPSPAYVYPERAEHEAARVNGEVQQLRSPDDGAHGRGHDDTVHGVRS